MASQQYSNNPPSYDQVVAESYHQQIAAATVHAEPSAPSASSASYPRQEFVQQQPTAHAFVAPVQGTVPYYGAMDGNKVTVQIMPQVTTQPLPGQRAETITQQIIVVNGCPACRIGMLEDDYSCLGIFCAIFFFPLGILVCLALRNRRCTNCGAQF
ncbi:membrane protein BRI3 [Anopheles ziemanni]|uniref:membrane protein BRI3 n=1 Tax=Anopheles ziemanni TaxID=345580 RepID=UPI00265B6330|nr:membrane protein BRI3 isoform X1 [Anopheles coustani]XP_058166819.1 membrane protein BRI3 [Anopheles ziemanni]